MRQFRKIKRDDPKCATLLRVTPTLSRPIAHHCSLSSPLSPRRSAFRVAEDARLARLSTKLSASLAKPKELTDAEEYRRQQDGYEEIEPVAGSSKGPSSLSLSVTAAYFRLTSAHSA